MSAFFCILNSQLFDSTCAKYILNKYLLNLSINGQGVLSASVRIITFDMTNGITLPTKNCHLPSASTRIRSLATAVTVFQHPLKEGQECDLGKYQQNRLLIVRYFQEKILLA